MSTDNRVTDVVDCSTTQIRRIDQLWTHIESMESPLSVVLRTKDEVFEDVPIRFWWNHGRFKHESLDAPEHSQIVFDIPDEVWRRVQSRYATKFKRRFFGSDDKADIPRAIRSQDQTNPHREMLPVTFRSASFTIEHLPTDDWFSLRTAVESTVRSLNIPHSMTSPKLLLHGNVEASGRIVDQQLQISLPDEAVTQIVGNWQAAVRKKLGFRS